MWAIKRNRFRHPAAQAMPVFDATTRGSLLKRRLEGDRDIGDAGETEDAAIAGDFCGVAEGFLEVVGEFDSRAAVDVV